MIIVADCVEAMRAMAENSVDAIVTDPPYAIGFMSKQWDVVGKKEDGPMRVVRWFENWAREALRVLKPGGHLLVFGGSRTYHSMAMGVELAGFEIRDQIQWVYGQGFPKSMDVGKAIDKRGGYPQLAAEIGKAIKAARESRGLSASECDKRYCGGTTNWSWFEGRPRGQRAPTPGTFAKIAAEWPELAPLADKVAQAEREVVGKGSAGCFNASDEDRHTIGGSKAVEVDITAPATPAAKQWDGWGTALKPSHEPLVWARKPLTVGTLDATMEETGNLIGAILCRLLLSANSAETLSESSLPVPDEAPASAALIAAVLRGGQSDEWCEKMATSNSPETVSMCLSIARSWRTILGVHSDHESTFTTATETELTTALRTLNSSLLAIIPSTIIRAASTPVGELYPAQDAEQSSAEGSWNSMPTVWRTADAIATLRQTLTSANAAENDFTAAALVASSALASATTSLVENLGPDVAPNHSPIVLARKPFKGSVASNVLQHGTGAINVDGCRVPMRSDDGWDVPQRDTKSQNPSRSAEANGTPSEGRIGERSTPADGGRWPANFIHDGSDEATEGLGAAARFFYVAKPGKKEKMASVSCGCTDPKGTPWVREALSRNEPMVFTSLGRDTSEGSSTESRSYSTDTSGNPSMDPSPTATSYTTSTETSKTTESRTSSSSPARTTSESTQDANCETGSGGSLAVSAENSSPSPSNTGTSAKSSGPSMAVVVPATSVASYRTRSCADCGQNLRTESHPTQKPVALMAYLCRLVTPPGGTVLDPFMGSGTTGVAALQEGFEFVGIEREAKYAAIAEARITNVNA